MGRNKEKISSASRGSLKVRLILVSVLFALFGSGLVGRLFFLQVIKNEDVELLLERFEEAYTNALMRRRFVIDNSDQTIEETFSEFVEKFEHHMNEADRRRILLHNQWNEIGPLA